MAAIFAIPLIFLACLFPSGYAQSVGCGQPAAAYRPEIEVSEYLIIGGKKANLHSWPWMVSMYRKDPPHPNFQLCGGGFIHRGCGGTLIRISEDQEESDLVLTAAHCVSKHPKNGTNDFSNLYIQAGSNKAPPTLNRDAGSCDENDDRTHRKVIQIEWHQDSVNNPVGYKWFPDIAILKLNQSIRFSDTIRPVCLPPQNDQLPVGRECVALGWGRTDPDDENKSSDELQQTLSPVHSVETCLKGWRDGRFAYGPEGPWHYGLICSGTLDAKSGICYGDSGGPLICKDDNGSWVQHGITALVAHYPLCLDKGQPPGFTRVANYVDWINQKIREMSDLVEGQ